MRKTLLLLITGLILSVAARAQLHADLQRRSEFSVGLEGARTANGWTFEDGGRMADWGLGFSVKYVYNINNLLASTFQTGYIYFPGNQFTWGKTNSGQFPLKAGLRFKAGTVYLEPQCGLSVLSNAGTPFTYALGVGKLIKKSFDIGFRYEGLTSEASKGAMGYLALRVAYRMPLETE